MNYTPPPPPPLSHCDIFSERLDWIEKWWWWWCVVHYLAVIMYVCMYVCVCVCSLCACHAEQLPPTDTALHQHTATDWTCFI
jgi:hypothetical protein